MRGRAALVSVLMAGAALGIAPAAAAQEVTTTTILPILPALIASPLSGPAGTEVSLSGRFCAGNGGEFVTLTFNGADQNIPVDGQDPWSTKITIPGAAEVGDEFPIHARCAKATSTIFYYASPAFKVTAPTPTSTVSTSTTATTATTITVIDVLGPTPTTAATVAPDAALPRTGANDATGLIALAVSLIGAGGVLILARRRARGA